MSQHTIKTSGSLSDSRVLEFYDEIEELSKLTNSQCYFGLKQVNLEKLRELSLAQNSKNFDRFSGYIFSNAFSIHYHRGVTKNKNDPLNDVHRTPHPYLDEFIITSHNNQNPTVKNFVAISKIIEKYCVLKVPENVDKEGTSTLDLLQNQMASMIEFHSKMLVDAEDQRQNFTELQKVHFEEIEKNDEDRRKKFDLEIDAERRKTETVRKELQKAKSKIDDRNHMHVRRELREKIGENVITQVQNIDTSKRGMWVFLFGLVVAASAFSLAIYSFNVLDTSLDLHAATSDPILLERYSRLALIAGIRGSLASIAALGFLIFCLSWLRRNFLATEKKKTDLERYSLDINRASWVIETIMEMTTKDGRVLPDKWIDGACYGLFHTELQTDNNQNGSLEALGALLQVTGRAEVGSEGTKLEFDNKGLQKAVKASKS